jgi:hypothetical protein
VVAAAIADKEAKDAAAAALWTAAEQARVRAVNAAEMARRVDEHKASVAGGRQRNVERQRRRAEAMAAREAGAYTRSRQSST